MKHRFSVIVVALALFGAACAGSGEPDNYDATVRDNFTEGCTKTGEASGLSKALEDVCSCAYDRFIATVPYVDFKAFDDELRDDLEASFPDQYSEIFADCIGTVSATGT